MTGPTVLVVDDTEANRSLLRYLLGTAGYTVAEAATGEAGLELVHALQPDLVLLDVHLPGIDGLEVCRRLKSDPATARIPVIQTSATSVTSDDRVEALDLGADAYLVHPTPPAELLAIVRALLRLAAAEAAAAVHVQRWRAVFSGSMVPMAVVARSGEVIDVNGAFESLVGIDRDALAGAAFDSLASGGIEPAALAEIGSRLATDGAVGREIVLRHAGGREMPCQVALTLVRDARAAEVLLQATDLSDARARAAEIEEARSRADAASQAKSDFVSRISHELRTPLNSILGFSQLLELQDLDAEARECVEHVGRAGRHLLDMVNELLDLARIEARRLDLSIEPVDAAALLAEAWALIVPLAEDAGLQPALRPSPPSFVLADRQRLLQILLNLLSNAVKYNTAGGCVRAWVEPDGGQIAIVVEDTGLGIATDLQPMLFQPFERLQADGQGTGLGLALSRSLAEAMEGSVTVDSEPGRGSRFAVRLPAAEPYGDGPTPTLQPPPAAAEASVPTRRVLYVEDNLANVALVRRVLRRRDDIELVVAQQGTLGVTLARQHPPALVLLDLHLPDIGGEEVLQRLRADDRTRHVPVVVLSADATAGQVERLLAAGAARYLTKPFQIDDLLGAIDDLAEAPA